MPNDPTPTAGEQLADLERCLADANWGAVMADHGADRLAARITALEEVLATPWPLRLLAAWRLGRVLRASVAPWPGGTFAERRTEAVFYEGLNGGQR